MDSGDVIPVHRLEATSLLEHRFYPYHHIASDNPQSLPLSLPPPIKAVSPALSTTRRGFAARGVRAVD